MYTAPAHDPTDADPHGRVSRDAPLAAIAQAVAGAAVTKSANAAIRAVQPALAAGLRVAAGILRAALRR